MGWTAEGYALYKSGGIRYIGPSATVPCTDAAQTRQHRRFVGPRVRHGAIVIAFPESPSIEQARDARLHGGQHLVDVQGRQATCGVKVQDAGTVPREDAVQHERVDMEIEIECPAESLNHRHRAPTRGFSVLETGTRLAF